MAIIPARAGSKRLPGKNLKPLGGVPLIAWSIRVALAAGCFSRVIVSTDDRTIEAVAKQFGAEVPWLRPPALATDKAAMIDVVLEILEKLERDQTSLPDRIMLLQPTSPFRSIESIHRAAALFQEAKEESVVSVNMASTHPYWCRSVDDNGELKPFLPDVDAPVYAQALPPVYELNGLIYLASVQTLQTDKSFYSPHTRALIIQDEEEGIDIDTELDWRVANAILDKRLGKNLS